MHREDCIIEVFCLISDWLSNYLKTHKITLRRRGPKPKLGDDEVLTMEILGEMWKMDTDTDIHRYFLTHWKSLFPTIGDRSNFSQQSRFLWRIKQLCQADFAQKLLTYSAPLYIVDGFPIPMCNVQRAGRSRLFKGCAEHGYCSSKKLYYFGFKGHLLTTQEGVIVDCTLTPANVDERVAAEDFTHSLSGVLLGDKGYIGKQEYFAQYNIQLETPYRSNMKNQHSKSYERWMKDKRRLIETVISQLSERFNIQKLRARNILNLTARIWRKLLSHTVAVYLHKLHFNQFLTLENVC